MALKWKTKILLARIETSYGVDAAPTGANGILATNVELTPMDGQDVSRDLELPYLGGQATVPAELTAQLAFRVELVGGGDANAGVAPAWGPLLRACGVAETLTPETAPGAGDGKVEYNPVSSDHESVTFYFWIENTRWVLKGTRGTCVLRFATQAIPYLEFTFRGLFAVPSEEARVTPVLSGFQKPQLVTSAFTTTFAFDGVPLVMRSTSLNLGNDVQARFLVGSESILIVDRADQLEAQVEAVPLTTLNPFALALDQATAPLVLVHGTIPGKRVRLDVPLAQMQRPQGLANEQNITEWPLRLAALPSDAGNDQWTLTLN